MIISKYLSLKTFEETIALQIIIFLVITSFKWVKWNQYHKKSHKNVFY